MAGKLQREDFKTEAELISAGGAKSQLLNDTEIYVTASGINKTLDDAIIDGDIGGGGSGVEALIIKDLKSTGTHGGTFTSGSYAVRVLQTTSGDTSYLVSLTSNIFTLPTGTYNIWASCPASEVGTHKMKLFNNTDSSDEIIGSTTRVGTTVGVDPHSFLVGAFTIVGNKSFTIRHRCQTSKATTGLGRAAGFGDQELYTQVAIWKVA